MTLPALLLGLIIASLYGAAFHFWRGGNFEHLLLYLILGWAGFIGGQTVASIFGLDFASIGTLKLGMASIGSIIFLLGGYWLSLIETNGAGG